MATPKKSVRTTKAATRKMPARKTAPRSKQGEGPTEIIARQVKATPAKVKETGKAVANTVANKTKIVKDFLTEHPKVAASLAAGIITVGSALLAKKLQGSATPKNAEGAAKQIADAVQKILHK